MNSTLDDESWEYSKKPGQGKKKPAASKPPVHRRLVVLLPASKPDPSLCKVITSAIAMGYPSPHIINWGRKMEDGKDGWWGGPHLSKIIGAVEYLEWMSRDIVHEGDRLRDDDLVFLVDAYDVWFQLPPEVLIKRWHGANQEANRRLAKQWTSAGPPPFSQLIVMSSQKRCYPDWDDGSNPHCGDLPDSPLRNDLYGPETDNGVEHLLKPKFANSGSILGPFKEMKRYLRQVRNQMEKLKADGKWMKSDQGIFSQVLGEQEIWRKYVMAAQECKQIHYDQGTRMMLDHFEFQVGLDYSQQITIPTESAHEDGRILRVNDQAFIAEHSKELGIDPVRLTAVPKDIQLARNPLQGLAIVPDEQLNWADMPLYADFFTRAIPATIHHNAWADGRKGRNKEWWDQTWFFPHLRELLTHNLQPGTLAPLANVTLAGGNVLYWALPSDEFQRKPRVFDVGRSGEGLPEVEFEGVCRWWNETETWERRWWDEVFRDGKGPLVV